MSNNTPSPSAWRASGESGDAERLGDAELVASGDGGGIFRSSGTVTLRNTIVAKDFKGGVLQVETATVVGTITGAGNQTFLGLAPVSYTGPWAGIDLEPDLVSYPIKNVTVSNNTISDNGGAGILMALATNSGLPAVADQIKLSGNTITRNGQSNGPFLRGGICLQGGQADGQGRLSVTKNKIVANGGVGLCRHPEGFNMRITLSKNKIKDNADGNNAW